MDTDTGEVKLLTLSTAHDVGKIVNPIGHQGQINGGAMQGIGYALMEELAVEDGRVTTLTFGDYKIPTIQDIPELTIVLLDEPTGPTPYQGKGIGETSNVPVAASSATRRSPAVKMTRAGVPSSPGQ